MKIKLVSAAADGTAGNSWSYYSTIAGDGGSVAFLSAASNLVTGDTNGSRNIFVKDLTTGAIALVDTATDGAQANNSGGYSSTLSDGHVVGFDSSASNLVAGDSNGSNDVFVKNLSTGAIVRASTAADGAQANSWSGQASLRASASPWVSR